MLYLRAMVSMSMERLIEILSADVKGRGVRWNVPPKERSQAKEAAQTKEANGAFAGHWGASDHNLVHGAQLLSIITGRMNSPSEVHRCDSGTLWHISLFLCSSHWFACLIFTAPC